MVLEIRLSNFFSIKDEIVLDMRTGNCKSAKAQALQANSFAYKDAQVLKSIAIYGANASGKSNIIKAIRFCCSMVVLSHTYNKNTVFDFYPFKFEDYSQQPSYFFIRFVTGGIEYEYSYSLTCTEILTEDLYYYPNGRRAKIFSRDEKHGKEKNKIYSFGSVIRKPMDVAENTSRKTLYISRASQMDRDLAKEIFHFFNSTFVLNYLNYREQVIDKLYSDNRETLLKALKTADSDIVNISLKHSVFNTYHKADDKVPFNLTIDESSGTQTLFFIMLSIIDVVKNSKILLIDKIESSLHSC
jgi:AAA15 family ATPase/GTPase